MSKELPALPECIASMMDSSDCLPSSRAYTAIENFSIRIVYIQAFLEYGWDNLTNSMEAVTVTVTAVVAVLI